MNNKDIILTYLLIGFLYWIYNILVRKLHRKNESGDGWFLSLLWIFGWPVFLVASVIWKLRKSYTVHFSYGLAGDFKRLSLEFNRWKFFNLKKKAFKSVVKYSEPFKTADDIIIHAIYDSKGKILFSNPFA